MVHGNGMIYLITSLVAFCSIVYELLLAQGLTMVWGHSLVRFAQTIGCYLFALGVGALSLSPHKTRADSLKLLTSIEIILGLIGYILPFLWVVALPLGEGWSLWIYLQGLIFSVGFLSGLEIPLLMRAHSGSLILAIDYGATSIGAVLFPFWVDQWVGLVQGSILVGLMNLLAACGLVWLRNDLKNPALLWSFLILLMGIGVLLLINESSYRASLSVLMTS